MNDQLDDMYREVILDHYRAPRGSKPIEHIDLTSEGKNPSCGDEIALTVAMDDGRVQDIHVDCHGCAISTASASMLAEYIKGKTLDDAIRIADIVKKMLKGEETEIPDDYDDLEALKGVRNFPVRIKCALLAWMTLIEGLKNYKAGLDGKHVTSVSTEDKE
jgi:nitrogen fixation NifU-like protein